jgi:uncharacterized protein (TIGR03086 family)
MSDPTSDVDVLESVLVKDATLIAAVRPEQLGDPTPCGDYDVKALVDHILGWMQRFAASANGEVFEGDAGAFHSEDPVTDYHAMSSRLIDGWRRYGMERTLPSGSGEGTPARQGLGMAIIEYVTHGWDLASGIRAEVPFTDEEFEVALGYGQEMLTDEYRGEGMPFGPRVEVSADAPVGDRFIAFMGRQP